MKRRLSFKQIQDFKEIASILKVSFEEVENFVFDMREKTIDQRYAEMLEEIENERREV